MSLRRIEKIRCYANPHNSHFQLLLSKTKSHPAVLRGFQSEASIREKNSIYLRNDVHGSQSSQIESLCRTFDLKSFRYISPFSYTRNKNEKKESTSTAVNEQQCKKCAKIRKYVKTFVRATFETEKPDAGATKTGLADEPNRIRMRIFKDEPDKVAIIESQTIANTTECFGCDQPKRESSIRGPPIISPVCSGNVSACPLGEVFKNAPERVKKIVKIDRPRSLGYRKRMVEKDQPRETSVHETRKPHGR